jgi:hypothetical protein
MFVPEHRQRRYEAGLLCPVCFNLSYMFKANIDVLSYLVYLAQQPLRYTHSAQNAVVQRNRHVSYESISLYSFYLNLL